MLVDDSVARITGWGGIGATETVTENRTEKAAKLLAGELAR